MFLVRSNSSQQCSRGRSPIEYVILASLGRLAKLPGLLLSAIMSGVGVELNWFRVGRRLLLEYSEDLLVFARFY